MKEVITNSIYFGAALSLVCYSLGLLIKKRVPYEICNPLLLATVFVIIVLKVFQIDYEDYNNGASHITALMQPATVCLAVPLFRQIQALKKHMGAILISIFCGCVSHVLVVVGLGAVFGVDHVLIASILPKSVTTPIALGISGEIGGIEAVTVIGVVVAGMMGAIVAPKIYKILKIKEPVAQGLGLGTASHAVGTSKAVELGEVQAAMSSLAIVVTGIMTVVIVPIVADWLY